MYNFTEYRTECDPAIVTGITQVIFILRHWNNSRHQQILTDKTVRNMTHIRSDFTSLLNVCHVFLRFVCQDLLVSTIIPMSKNQNNQSDSSNYRRITLSSELVRCINQIVRQHVVEILPCYYADATMTISHIFVLVYICLTA